MGFKGLKFKPGVDPADFNKLTDNTKELFVFVGKYCQENDLPFVVTSLCEDVEGRVFNGHKDGRAFDISTRGWSRLAIQRLRHLANSKFKDIAAISNSDKKPRAVVFHKIDGNVKHIHVQARS